MRAPARFRPIPYVPLKRRSWGHLLGLRAGVVCCSIVVAFAALPPAVLLARALMGDATPTGALTGLAVDQLQYLAWVRESGEGILVSNRFTLDGSGGAFLHPLFVVSGLLSQLGIPQSAAWFLWTPVAVALLLYAALAYLRRMLSPGSSRSAALILVFFLTPPVLPLLDLLGVERWVAELNLLRMFTFQLQAATGLWGYVLKAFAVALLPLVFLTLERAFEEPAKRRRLVAACAGMGLLISWCHPWQGVTLGLILCGLLVWYRFERSKAVALVAIGAAAALPLLYYFALSRLNGDWIAAGADPLPTPTAAQMLLTALGLSPFIALAALGVRRPRDMQEMVLLLWPAACAVTLLVPATGWEYATAGASLPLAVLMVRGWRRLPLRGLRARGLARPLAIALIAFIAVPGAADLVDGFRFQVKTNWFLYYSKPEEHRALEFLRDHPEPGGVFATPSYGGVVPATTGRRVWNGHFAWTPDYENRNALAKQMMDGRLSPRTVRAVLTGSGAEFFLADCRFPPARVRDALGRAVAPVRTFGCAGVYRIAGG